MERTDMNDLSPDGREIWAWAHRVGDLLQKQAKIEKLRQGIRDLRPKCGNCFLWMKSGECPQETRNKQGRRVGPSCNGFACSKFVEVKWVTELRAEMEAAINTIEG